MARHLPLGARFTESPDVEVINEVGDALSDNTTEQWLRAALILVVAFVIARIAKSVVSRIVDRASSSTFLGDLLGRLLAYLLVSVGLVYALEEIGVRITPLLGALGLLGIAIAFALQSILENFIAGVLLQVRRPFQKGDEIESGDFVGSIQSIDARTLTILTPDGEMVRLPNARVLSEPIVNLSENGRRRTSLDVGVAYGSDVAAAADTAQRAVADADGVLAHPRAVAYAKAFGASSIDITVMYWHEPSIAEMHRVRHNVMVAVAAAFERDGITIPFPQRTLHLAPELHDLAHRGLLASRNGIVSGPELGAADQPIGGDS